MQLNLLKSMMMYFLLASRHSFTPEGIFQRQECRARRIFFSLREKGDEIKAELDFLELQLIYIFFRVLMTCVKKFKPFNA